MAPCAHLKQCLRDFLNLFFFRYSGFFSSRADRPETRINTCSDSHDADLHTAVPFVGLVDTLLYLEFKPPKRPNPEFEPET